MNTDVYNLYRQALREVDAAEFLISPSDDSQRKQYEEWLQETQQLLQMQQKYLEEQIGAHRKSKKALSAKQRTARKAGREFPEEDAEQLKHVTEQQSVVQKQLEQVSPGGPARCPGVAQQSYGSPIGVNGHPDVHVLERQLRGLRTCRDTSPSPAPGNDVRRVSPS